MTLAQVQASVEAELIMLIKSAWGVSKVHTAPKEVETTSATLPEAFLILTEAVPLDEEEQTMCSESARLVWSVLLHAKKPITSTLALEKRTKAQALRSGILGATFTDASQVLWLGESYDAREDAETEATNGAYLIRARFSTLVEWTD
jgi:hypothetical protein